MKQRIAILALLVLSAGAVQAQDCAVVPPAPVGFVPPTSATLSVGPNSFAADADFALIPACSTTVTKSCLSGVNLKRNGTTITPGGSCTVPAGATGKQGLKITVNLTAPLNTSDLTMTASYRDESGALKETSFSNLLQVLLQAVPLKDFRPVP